MKIWIIHPTNPETKHVSALRAWKFACELHAFGHEVTIFCSQNDEKPSGARPDYPIQSSAPRIIAVGSYRREDLRNYGRLHRKIRTAYGLLRWGGRNGQWTRDVISEGLRLSNTNPPDIVWTTFGCLESLIASRKIAKSIKRPWVLDVKDNWSTFIPKGLRRLMVRRTAGWVALTANADGTLEKTKKYLKGNGRVVYSGLSRAYETATAPIASANEKFSIRIIGSVYSATYIRTLLTGIEKMLLSVNAEQQEDITIVYLGNDITKLNNSMPENSFARKIENAGYLSEIPYVNICQSRGVNCFINPDWFSHKLVELIACAQPMLVVPRIGVEAHRLAAKGGARLYECPTADLVAETIKSCFEQDHRNKTNLLGEFKIQHSWKTQARHLEQVLKRTVARSIRQT